MYLASARFDPVPHLVGHLPDVVLVQLLLGDREAEGGQTAGLAQRFQGVHVDVGVRRSGEDHREEVHLVHGPADAQVVLLSVGRPDVQDIAQTGAQDRQGSPLDQHLFPGRGPGAADREDLVDADVPVVPQGRDLHVLPDPRRDLDLHPDGGAAVGVADPLHATDRVQQLLVEGVGGDDGTLRADAAVVGAHVAQQDHPAAGDTAEGKDANGDGEDHQERAGLVAPEVLQDLAPARAKHASPASARPGTPPRSRRQPPGRHGSPAGPGRCRG